MYDLDVSALITSSQQSISHSDGVQHLGIDSVNHNSPSVLHKYIIL